MAGWEELLSALEGRIERVTASHDPAPVLEAAALDEARQLMRMMQEGKPDLKALYLLGWLFWYRYQASPEGQDEPELRAATTAFALCFIAGVSGLPPPLEPLLADQAVPTATAMLHDALQSPNQDLSATVDLWRRIVDATPPDHPERAERLSSLGGAMQARFERTGVLADLDAAVEAARAALKGIPASHPDRARYLFNLGAALGARFWRTEATADLDEAIEALRAAVDAAPPGHPDREASLSNLDTALGARFRRTEASTDLDEAIETLRALVDATPAGDPDLAQRLARLRGALFTRFARTGALDDLDEAIEAGRKAVDATPPGHPDLVERLASLASALQTRSARTGALDDLDEAIEAGRKAVDATPPGHPDRAKILSDLGLALRNRFGQTGALADGNAAVEAAAAAADIIPPGHPDRAAILSNLGAALGARFRRTGTVDDLDAAVEALQDAVNGTPAEASERAAGYLSNLGAVLLSRFEHAGALADVDAAVEALQAAVDATPPDHPDWPGRCSNLGNALRRRFQRTGNLADLDVAVEALQDAVNATPTDRPERARYQSNLAAALLSRFEHAGALADLAAAVEAGHAAADATAADDPERPAYLTNVSNALRARFEQAGDQADLDAAIEALRAAVELSPAEHLELGRMLSNLGGLLRIRFERSRALADLDAAASAFVAAGQATSAAPSVRVWAFGQAGSLLADSQPGRAADVLEAAVRLLSEVAPRRLARTDQQHAIGGFSGLASDAAALALSDTDAGTTGSQRAARALGLLEAGRAILLSQALDTRDDLTDLRRQHPELAGLFIALRERLDQPEISSQPGASAQDFSPAVAARLASEERRRLADQLAETLAQIRALDRFARFGLPPTADQLLAEAAAGPVVTFNVSPYRSDALLLMGDGITSLPLLSLGYDALIGQIGAFYQALYTAADPDAGLEGRTAGQEKLSEILGWLWDAAGGPVLKALGYHHPPPGGVAWPRVWWAPGGLLSLLPVHSAGHHTERLASDHPRRTVMDRVISSYTPTIRALRHARQYVRHAAAPGGRTLIVAMPITPGLPGGGELPNVPLEVAKVRALLPDIVLLAESGNQQLGDSFDLPTRANVLDQLPSCPIAHFACHGFSDPADPSKSMLLLRDNERHPLTVASLAPVDLGQAELAYLSACDTALTSTGELIDEAIHLTTAFQLAGFPHVIGTLWKVNDELAVTIADNFYATLLTSRRGLDTSQAARAIQDAVRTARDRFPRKPSLWAAYAHAGT